MKKILTINHISKNYHNIKEEIKAIDDISFDIYKNEIIAIVGPSGCGKSTLLGILANLENKTKGNIIKEKDYIIGYMLQNDSLFPWLTVLENTLIGLERNNKNEENVRNVIHLLKKYGLYEFKDSYPDSLSGGMKQRVALIRTLAINPDLILLDEPFSALDYQTRLALSNDMYNIIKNENKTAIFITHDLSEAISIASKIIVLTKRPCKIKNIYEIKLNKPSNPIDNRKDAKFNYYFDKIWRDLDVHI